MNIVIDSKELGKVLSHLGNFAAAVNRDDEKAIHLFVDNNQLAVEAVKSEVIQVRYHAPLIKLNQQHEQRDFYIQWFQLNQLKPLLKIEEPLELFLVENTLNIKSQSRGSVLIEMYNNAEAHDYIKLVEDVEQYQCDIVIPEWHMISSRLDAYDNHFLFETEAQHNKIKITALFETSSFYSFHTRCGNVETDFSVNINQLALSYIKHLNEPQFQHLEDDILLVKGANGFVAVKNSSNTNKELDTVQELIQIKSDTSLATVSAPQSQLDTAISWQQFKLDSSDTLTLSVESEFVLIKGSNCEDPGRINSITVGQFITTEVNNKVLEKAVKLFKHNNSQIIDIEQCALQIEGDPEPIIYYVAEGEITQLTNLVVLFYSVVTQE